ncbi:hypothetical protein DFS34DRAFT_590442 [Phlyctochytrium arcticum]|nr:hypothetical protein DFS34DRAFT_590442 [Phlyctochytrium arcticum]
MTTNEDLIQSGIVFGREPDMRKQMITLYCQNGAIVSMLHDVIGNQVQHWAPSNALRSNLKDLATQVVFNSNKTTYVGEKVDVAKRAINDEIGITKKTGNQAPVKKKIEQLAGTFISACRRDLKSRLYADRRVSKLKVEKFAAKVFGVNTTANPNPNQINWAAVLVNS